MTKSLPRYLESVFILVGDSTTRSDFPIYILLLPGSITGARVAPSFKTV
jgi:hypothetical protein